MSGSRRGRWGFLGAVVSFPFSGCRSWSWCACGYRGASRWWDLAVRVFEDRDDYSWDWEDVCDV